MIARRFALGDKPRFAVVVTRGTVELHAGCVATSSGKEPVLLHLAWDKDFRVEKIPTDWAWVECSALPEQELRAASNFAIGLSKDRPLLRYSMIATDPTLDGEGKLVDGVCGVTCTTFVYALLKRVGIQLVDMTTWPTNRPADHAAQQKLAAILQRDSVEHAEGEAAAVGRVPRLRPEELAAASTLGVETPHGFAVVDPRARELRTQLNELGYRLVEDADAQASPSPA
jgi:hypothetical protein